MTSILNESLNFSYKSGSSVVRAWYLIKPKNAAQDRKLQSAKQSLDKLKFETQKLTSERDYLQERLDKE